MIMLFYLVKNKLETLDAMEDDNITTLGCRESIQE